MRVVFAYWYASYTTTQWQGNGSHLLIDARLLPVGCVHVGATIKRTQQRVPACRSMFKHQGAVNSPLHIRSCAKLSPSVVSLPAHSACQEWFELCRHLTRSLHPG